MVYIGVCIIYLRGCSCGEALTEVLIRWLIAGEPRALLTPALLTHLHRQSRVQPVHVGEGIGKRQNSVVVFVVKETQRPGGALQRQRESDVIRNCLPSCEREVDALILTHLVPSVRPEDGGLAVPVEPEDSPVALFGQLEGNGHHSVEEKMAAEEGLIDSLPREIAPRRRTHPVGVRHQDDDLCHVGVLSKWSVVDGEIDGFVPIGGDPGGSPQLASRLEELVVGEEDLSIDSNKPRHRVPTEGYEAVPIPPFPRSDSESEEVPV